MHASLHRAARGLTLALAILAAGAASAAPAISVLGKDFTFPNRIDGMPAKLSDFKDLQINHFTTSDGVRLAYWEAGKGKPLIFTPGWSANGAEYLNVMYLLSKKYRVIVLDPRNQGLSQQVDYGGHISRFAVDLKELNDHLGIKKADYVGWSMGASVLWSYIELFGTKSINKVAFIDEAPSIYSHADWTEKERVDAGAMTSDVERMIESFTTGKMPSTMIVNSQAFQRAGLMDSPYYENSEAFAKAFIKTNMTATGRVMFDHFTNDWRDVIAKRIDVPTAIFTGVYSDSAGGQRWIHAVVPNSELHVYTAQEQGDHFLAFKNPLKFTADLDAFLKK
ncbi:alpha/beta fold hydrolase [Massilia sp. HP4]|uniref:alpha/beta fold hydrolase n=1 Tax=Massilia sp. HP4 TaxID=2562316 RepID=UPI0010C05E47|nr:alpha/beta hydrolase [Massilia sp. HP4]